jgi:predicted alpha/beta-hydrolase family hydrolase
MTDLSISALNPCRNSHRGSDLTTGSQSLNPRWRSEIADVKSPIAGTDLTTGSQSLNPRWRSGIADNKSPIADSDLTIVSQSGHDCIGRQGIETSESRSKRK